jgi:hypothetical protein
LSIHLTGQTVHLPGFRFLSHCLGVDLLPSIGRLVQPGGIPRYGPCRRAHPCAGVPAGVCPGPWRYDCESTVRSPNRLQWPGEEHSFPFIAHLRRLLMSPFHAGRCNCSGLDARSSKCSDNVEPRDQYLPRLVHRDVPHCLVSTPPITSVGVLTPLQDGGSGWRRESLPGHKPGPGSESTLMPFVTG